MTAVLKRDYFQELPPKLTLLDSQNRTSGVSRNIYQFPSEVSAGKPRTALGREVYKYESASVRLKGPFGEAEFSYKGKFYKDYGFDNRYGYTGQEQDTPGGLMYYGARWYDSEIGRFISEDPAGAATQDPLTINRYVYCRNNPVNKIDPTGMWSIKATIGIFGFEIGDKGFSVTAFAIQLGVNFENGHVFGGLNAGIGFGVDAFGFTAGAGAGVVYRHDFASGGNDVMGAGAGVQFGLGGVSKGYGACYDFRTGHMSGGESDVEFNLDVARMLYNKAIKHDPVMAPGKGVPGEDVSQRPLQDPSKSYDPVTNPYVKDFVDGANCIGNPVGEPANGLETIYKDGIPGREGGLLSRAMNQIPGQNAFSYVHDSWSPNIVVSIAAVFSAQITTYGAWTRSLLPSYTNCNSGFDFTNSGVW
jgi:RHS repeat-associated protein